MTKRTILLAGLLLGGWGLSAQRAAVPVSLTLPAGGGAVAIGDLSGDGKPDIVTAGRDSVTVYAGDGRGGFASGSPFAAGENPSDLALADFNEDGRLDIAIANHETSYLTILVGDGRGRLKPPSRIPAPSRPHPHGIAAGDFNGDRHVDLAVESWEENTVLVLDGDGRARFAEQPRRLLVGRKPYWKLRAGDLDNDGTDDIVTTNGDGGSVAVLCTGGTRTLQPAKEIATVRSPFAVAMGDVNGDRRPDLAVAHRWGSVDPTRDGLTVLVGRGECAFTPTSESPMKVGASPTAVAIGDVDGDGIGDIATANMGSDNVTVLLGSRSAGFRPASGSPFAVGKGPTAIAVGDLNGDHKADIITGGNDVTVLISP